MTAQPLPTALPAPTVPGAARERSIRIAVLAMGGEGGGVLADWIVKMAERAGHRAQTTSVPGVAQRTGATIYYIELFPPKAAGSNAPDPVLALMPVPGDVDVVLASELMEAGRAIQRGIVTPDRTTLVTSTNRVFAMTEKIALGDGRVDDAALFEACTLAANRLVAFDMAALAERNGSVISAALFGALAGSRALPFARSDFEETIREGGVGVAPSLRAFGASFEEAVKPPGLSAPDRTMPSAPADRQDLAHLIASAEAAVPAAAREVIRAGVLKTADHQDLAYARDYVARVERMVAVDRAHGDGSHRLVVEVARYLALGMAYEDTIRVAELKIRASRFRRVAEEVRLKDGQILEIAEFLHPRLQEIAETVPAPLGRFLLNVRWARNMVEAATSSGKVVTTTSLRGFLMLYAVARMKPLRRRSMRWAEEQAHLDRWLAVVAETAARDHDLAVETAECLNLVKGYGDTHMRGKTNYARILAVLAQVPSAAVLADLRKAALADEHGNKLTEAMARHGLAP
ncbi:MAG: indolepyruvate oxidoreductase subunit beta family protein [Rhodospirillales bacterium]|jgi:indolepyruvate ferredoxin oxidoreductase beta subunit